MIKKILCMGSINIDLIMYMNKLPIEGETIVTDNFSTCPGGKGGNQAATVAITGGKASFLTRLGDDEFSSQLTNSLKKNGVDMNSVIYQKGETSGIAMIRVDEKGVNSISFTPGANQMISKQDIKDNENMFEENDILLVTMEIPVKTVFEAIKMAKKHSMVVILDPSPTPVSGIPRDIAKLVDYVKPNEIEAEMLSGIAVVDDKSASKALYKLREIGFLTPIITMSNKGVLTFIDNKEYKLEPMKVNAVDTTAAGDIFLGSFASALSQGNNFEFCLKYANIVAGISTTKKGAQTSIPNKREIEINL